jgi:hypothetical protein
MLVRWYRALDQQASGEVILVGDGAAVADNAPNVPHPVIQAHTFEPPVAQHAAAVTFDTPSAPIQLRGFDLITSSQALSLTLYWSAPATLTQDYKSFVHLAPLDNPEPLRQADRFTRDGMYPTGMWLPGEVVSDTVTLDLRDVPAGEYQLAMGWYDPNTLARLPGRDNGVVLSDGRYVLAKIRH